MIDIQLHGGDDPLIALVAAVVGGIMVSGTTWLIARRGTKDTENALTQDWSKWLTDSTRAADERAQDHARQMRRWEEEREDQRKRWKDDLDRQRDERDRARRVDLFAGLIHESREVERLLDLHRVDAIAAFSKPGSLVADPPNLSNAARLLNEIELLAPPVWPAARTLYLALATFTGWQWLPGMPDPAGDRPGLRADRARLTTARDAFVRACQVDLGTLGEPR